jgi:hypothetical protein
VVPSLHVGAPFDVDARGSPLCPPINLALFKVVRYTIGQQIPTTLCTWGNLTDKINREKLNQGWLRGLGWAGARKSYVSTGKHMVVLNTMLRAASLARKK